MPSATVVNLRMTSVRDPGAGGAALWGEFTAVHTKNGEGEGMEMGRWGGRDIFHKSLLHQISGIPLLKKEIIIVTYVNDENPADGLGAAKKTVETYCIILTDFYTIEDEYCRISDSSFG